MNNPSTDQLFKFDQNVDVLHTLVEPEDINVVLKVCSTHAKVSKCKHVSPRHHSRYSRKVDDLPVFNHSVHLTILLHKWFCVNTKCEMKIFTERLNWLSPSGEKQPDWKSCYACCANGQFCLSIMIHKLITA
ncbi:hypothetical protein [Metabacillus sp. RGM 3146]|uniref:hypothetical protein n=1 Tax=Metabacillus sp. RGM 3146 TaxID=3401092 RepID=UPI003B98FFA2